MKNKDPFESHIFCTLLFGGVFFIAFVFKLFQLVIAKFDQKNAAQIFNPDMLRPLEMFIVFAFSSGLTVPKLDG